MTVHTALKDQIVEDLARLTPEQLARVQGYVEALAARIPGTPGRDLLPFLGTLDEESAREMAEAIERHCEQVDESGW
jgi:hypothetical protein